MKSLPIVLAAALAATPLNAQDVRTGDPAGAAAASAVLDDIHRLAHEGDFEGYFALYSEDAVFLGTDASEHWTKAEFQEYSRAPFADGHGWTYTPIERHVHVAPGGQVAWFDERLTNEAYGETRGTGVLVLEGGAWKVAQYNLTFPIPNEIAREVVTRIREVTGGG